MYRSKEIEKYNEYCPAQWSDKTHTYRAIFRYGMHYIFGNSQPYFSLTGSTWRQPKNILNKSRWDEDSCGCMHDLIRERASDLAPLIKFHLAEQDGLPMYYLENGYYWYKENLETFKSYILLENEEIIPDVSLFSLESQKEIIINWLESRKPRLRQRFDETMAKFNVEYITQKEIDELKTKEKMNERAKVFNSYLGATPVK